MGGAGVNFLVGRTIVGTASKVFGPAPQAFGSGEHERMEADRIEPEWVIDEEDLDGEGRSE